MAALRDLAFVYVVESPGDEDLLDGRTEGRSMCEALKLADIPHSYSLAATENALAVALGPRLASESQRLGRRPILHLSMHGNSDGVALTNGFFLWWSDLYHRLEPLLLEMDNSLLIGMSSCEGLGAIRMAMQSEEIPVPFAVVGSDQSVAVSSPNRNTGLLN